MSPGECVSPVCHDQACGSEQAEDDLVSFERLVCEQADLGARDCVGSSSRKAGAVLIS